MSKVKVPDYELYYWSVPFRGQFVRAILAFAGKTWVEADDASILKMMSEPVQDMLVPFMGPPVLVDKKTNFAIAEMPAIALYLGETLGLMPATAELRAMTMKIVNDANDVIDEITRDGGREMWTEKRWKEFRPRLKKWMSIWEETGIRHGMQADSGFILGGAQPGIADIVTSTLWTTLTERFPKIGKLLEKTAPMTADLSRRVAAIPDLAELAAKARADYGDAYCGGKIGASMQKIIGTKK